jgi:hypothetical protein
LGEGKRAKSVGRDRLAIEIDDRPIDEAIRIKSFDLNRHRTNRIANLNGTAIGRRGDAHERRERFSNLQLKNRTDIDPVDIRDTAARENISSGEQKKFVHAIAHYLRAEVVARAPFRREESEVSLALPFDHLEISAYENIAPGQHLNS